MQNEKAPFPLPDVKGYDRAYELALTMACNVLIHNDNIVEQCRKSASQYQKLDSREIISVQYLNQSYQIILDDGKVSLNNNANTVPIRDKLLILHYFNTATGTPPSGQTITFRDLPEGAVYYPTFSKRTIIPLVNYFGNNPQNLKTVSEVLDGQKADIGDTGIRIFAFLRVPLTITIWKGDTEFPASGNILFDRTITDYLPTEDIIVLCETITWKLIHSLKEQDNLDS